MAPACASARREGKRRDHGHGTLCGSPPLAPQGAVTACQCQCQWRDASVPVSPCRCPTQARASSIRVLNVNSDAWTRDPHWQRLRRLPLLQASLSMPMRQDETRRQANHPPFAGGAAGTFALGPASYRSPPHSGEGHSGRRAGRGEGPWGPELPPVSSIVPRCPSLAVSRFHAYERPFPSRPYHVHVHVHVRNGDSLPPFPPRVLHSSQFTVHGPRCTVHRPAKILLLHPESRCRG